MRGNLNSSKNSQNQKGRKHGVHEEQHEQVRNKCFARRAPTSLCTLEDRREIVCERRHGVFARFGNDLRRYELQAGALRQGKSRAGRGFFGGG